MKTNRTPVEQQKAHAVSAHRDGSRHLFAAKERGRRAAVCALWLAAAAVGAAAAADRYWVAVGAGSWSDADNWSAASGGDPGAGMPGSGDTAFFDGGGSGDCAFDTAVAVKGLTITNGYGGTVAQGEHPLAVGAGGYAQFAGTFAGGTADIVITVSSKTPFTLAGGAFTSTSGTLSLACGTYDIKAFVFTGGSFQHNNGTLLFASAYSQTWARYQTITVALPLSLHHLSFIGGNSQASKTFQYGIMPYVLSQSAGATVSVYGDFTMRRNDADTNRTVSLDGGEIHLYGNVIAGPGASGGTTKLVIKGDGDRTYATATAGQRNFEYNYLVRDSLLPHLRVEMSGGTFKPTAATTNLTVRAFELISGDFTAPPGVLATGLGEGVAAFHVRGGTFRHNGGVLRAGLDVTINWSRNHTLSLGQPVTLMHLDYAGGNSHADGSFYHSLSFTTNTAKLVVLGDFLLARWGADTNRTFRAMGGEIELYGNLIVGPGADGGTTKIVVKGDGDQTYSSAATGLRSYAREHTGNAYLPCLRVEKTGGSFVPAAAATNLTVTEFQLAAGAFTAPPGVFAVVKDSRALPGENNSMYGYNCFTFTNGVYHHNNGTLRLANYITDATTREYLFNLKCPLTLHHLDYAGGNDHATALVTHTLALTGEGGLTVAGDFTMERWGDSSNRTFRAMGGTIRAQGDVRVGPGAVGGTTAVLLDGDRDQTITQRGGTPPQGHWTLAKTGGAATLATDLVLSGAGQDLLWQDGALDLSSNTLSVGRNVSISPDATTFGVLVADAAMAGRLEAAGMASGIENADLNVTVAAALKASLPGASYTILSNNAVLGAVFASETWSPQPPATAVWDGKVDYTADGGKRVVIHGIIRKLPGSVLLLR